MRRALILTPLASLALAACGSGSDSKVTETRMDDIDSVEGTISDEMVPTDENAEMAPVEAVAAPATAKAKADDKGEAKPEPKAAEPDEAEGE